VPGEGQARILWEATPVDLYFWYDAFREPCSERRHRLPFGEGDAIHVLAPEDLLVFKAIFDRAQDWRDIEEVVSAMGKELEAISIQNRLLAAFSCR